MKVITSALMMSGFLGLFCGQAYAAADRVGGSGTTVNVTISDETLWTTLRSVTHTVTGAGANDCMVVASADVQHPGVGAAIPVGVEQTYHLTITRNVTTSSKNTSCSRQVGFVQNSSVNDINSSPVATNCSFTGLTTTNGIGGGPTHTFHFLGIKDVAATVDTPVLDSRIDFVCVDRD